MSADDPFEAILASMAAKTGNDHVASSPSKPSNPAGEKEEVEASAMLKSNKKRSRQERSNRSLIWNDAVVARLPDKLLQQVSRRAATMRVSPSMEIARQQNVRKLCTRIRQTNEQLGIKNTSPNAIYEAWQFSSKLNVPEGDPLMPDARSDFSGLLEHYTSAGASKKTGVKLCRQLTKEAEKLWRRFQQQNFTLSGQKHAKISRQQTTSSEQVVVSYGNTQVKLNASHFDKLQVLFERNRKNAGENFADALFCLALRYDSLDGGGFQAALNEECFDVLLRRFDCEMECFASPFNCRYGRFCSAFLDTDHAFGSVGSFFEFRPSFGCFEANPPFIPKLIKRMADHMKALLEQSDDPLAFIIIIPCWKETEGWQQLNSSHLKTRHLLLAQKDHGFCEGKQQIRPTRWRIASFDTSVFFWQNKAASRKWDVTEEALEELRVAFQSKQAQERDNLGLRRGGKRVKAMT